MPGEQVNAAPAFAARADGLPAARPTVRTAAPFLMLTAVGLVATMLPPYEGTWVHAVLAVLMVGVLAWAHREAMTRVERTWIDVAAPLGTFPLIALLRDASGGSTSGLAELVAVPIFWLACFGTRRDLHVCAGLAALTFALPVLVVGGPEYPAGEWRRVVLWTGVALVIAPVVQSVVRRLASESDRTRDIAARFEGILRGATLTSLVTTDREGVITSFGVGSERMTGYRAEDVVGRRFTDVCFRQEELEAVGRELGVPADFSVLSRLAHQGADSRVWTLATLDDRTAFVRMAVTELRDDREAVVGYLCVAIDATRATRNERELTQAEERWRALLDHLPDTTVVMVEERVGITLVTGAGVLAQRLRDGAGRRLTEIVDRDEPGRLGRMLGQAFGGQESDPVFAMVGTREHELVASPLPSTTHRRQALLMVRDVSEERDRARRLMAAKERAERLFQDAPQGIAVLGTDGTVLQVNPSLVALLGEDPTGRQLATLSEDPDDLTVPLHLARVRDGHERAETQLTVRGRDREPLHVVLVSTLLHGEDPTGAADTILTNVVDVSERYRYERQLAFLAEHDPLTGLANRRRFDTALERHVDECRRYGARGAVLMLDLDHFKDVNDTLGHAVGDEFLVEIGTLLQQRMRSTDLVARLGGDEFAVLLPHEDKESARLVAESIVDRVRIETMAWDDARRGVTVSIGGVIIEDVHASASDVLSAADAAMYVAKHSGRSRFAFLDVEESPRR
jgi:diguanylate cyclase (GGDEF)-like protein/PAS domain S-box-containing protein